MVCWAGQVNWWQTNDRGHSGWGESWVGVIFYYFGDYLSSRVGGGGGWTRCYKKKHFTRGKFSEILSVPPSADCPSPAKVDLAIIVSGVPCSMQVKHGPQPNQICIACNASQLAGRSQLARSLLRDAAWWSGKDTPQVPTQAVQLCRTYWWLVEETPETQFHRRLWPWPPTPAILSWNMLYSRRHTHHNSVVGVTNVPGKMWEGVNFRWKISVICTFLFNWINVYTEL